MFAWKPLLLAAGLFCPLMLRAAPSATVSTQTVYRSMCDASAAVALDADLFAVGNDEDNTLRIYRAAKGGPPVASVDLSSFLRPDLKWPETDLEGAAWLGEKIFWITSHGRNQDGKFRSSRHRFFATRLEKTNATVRLVPVGRSYGFLLRDLLRDARLRPFKLDAASLLPPKSPGALNIEGLCATPDGRLLIGFRNPIPQGRALVVPLLNPDELIAGRPAKFGDPLLLNLGGLGVRDLGYWRGRFVIIAGAHDAQGRSHLYQWNGGQSEPERMTGLHLRDFNPEAVVVYPEGREAFQILSDDGTVEIDGVGCKRLGWAVRKRFRGAWVTPAP